MFYMSIKEILFLITQCFHCSLSILIFKVLNSSTVAYCLSRCDLRPHFCSSFITVLPIYVYVSATVEWSQHAGVKKCSEWQLSVIFALKDTLRSQLGDLSLENTFNFKPFFLTVKHLSESEMHIVNQRGELRPQSHSPRDQSVSQEATRKKEKEKSNKQTTISQTSVTPERYRGQTDWKNRAIYNQFQDHLLKLST